MTVCSVNTGPGTCTLAEIGNHSPPRHCVSNQIIVVGGHILPPVYGDRDSEPSVSAVSPHSHTASGSSDHLHTEGVRRISWKAM